LSFSCPAIVLKKKSQSHQINEKKVAQGLKISYTPVEDDEDEDEDFGLIL